MKFCQLVDMAIGSPDTGRVNFSALHYLLSSIVDKLGINDEIVNYSNVENEDICCCNKMFNYNFLRKSRLYGGTSLKEATTKIMQTKSASESDETEVSEIIDIDVRLEDEPDETLLNAKQTITKRTENQVNKELHGLEQYKSVIEVLCTETSKGSIKCDRKPIDQPSIDKLDDHLSRLELTIQQKKTPEGILTGIAIMKDQLEFAIEQLLLLTFIMLNKKPDSNQIQQLHTMAQALQEFKTKNTYIEGSNCLQIANMPSLNWHSSRLQLNKDLSENDVLKPQRSVSQHTLKAMNMNREIHLCYSPDKLLDQVMELKSEFYLLTQKVNELSSCLLEQESQRTPALIYEIKNEIRDLKETTINLKEQQNKMGIHLTSNLSKIDNIRRTMEEIIVEKADKGHLEVQLADKVDYKRLQRKVSLDQMLELQCRIDKRFCEVFLQINENDKKYTLIFENVRETLGFAAFEGILKQFKQNITKDIQSLQKMLKSYIDSTNDDSVAAGARIKVVQDLACLSCDTNCVMRSMEKSKIGKLPNAHTSTMLNPLITYELSSVRKSDIIGYVPRHAGGHHTINSAKDRIAKAILNQK